MALNNETIKETPYNPNDNGQTKESNIQTLAEQSGKLIKQIENTERPIYSGNEAMPLSGLMILGGAPGAGKTSLALKIALNVARQENPVLFLSFEMPAKQVFARLLQISTNTELNTLLYSDNKADILQEKQAEIGHELQYISVLDITHYTTKDGIQAVNFDEIKQYIQAKQDATDKMPLLITDSLQTIPLPEAMQSKTIKEKIDFSLVHLRALADQTGAAVMAIAQGNRSQNTGANNKLFGFSGSGLIEYIVDAAYYLDVDEHGDNIDFSTLKNRYGKKAETINLHFDGEFTDFTDFDYDKDTPF